MGKTQPISKPVVRKKRLPTARPQAKGHSSTLQRPATRDETVRPINSRLGPREKTTITYSKDVSKSNPARPTSKYIRRENSTVISIQNHTSVRKRESLKEIPSSKPTQNLRPLSRIGTTERRPSSRPSATDGRPMSRSGVARPVSRYLQRQNSDANTDIESKKRNSDIVLNQTSKKPPIDSTIPPIDCKTVSDDCFIKSDECIKRVRPVSSKNIRHMNKLRLNSETDVTRSKMVQRENSFDNSLYNNVSFDKMSITDISIHSRGSQESLRFSNNYDTLKQTYHFETTDLFRTRVGNELPDKRTTAMIEEYLAKSKNAIL